MNALLDAPAFDTDVEFTLKMICQKTRHTLETGVVFS